MFSARIFSGMGRQSSLAGCNTLSVASNMLAQMPGSPFRLPIPQGIDDLLVGFDALFPLGPRKVFMKTAEENLQHIIKCRQGIESG